jgi:SpoIID/LytB domain protein
VIPRELGPLVYPYLEAQKTQAVAARTFARRRIQSCPVARCSNGYHTVPTTSDQVYGGLRGATGITNSYALSNQAVDETRGVVATYNGALVEALFSSTSGGFTANSEDVFLNAVPYLRGVPDHERGEALDHVPSLEVFRRHANPTNLRNHANGDFEGDWAIYHRWYTSWTAEEIRQVVGRLQLPAGTSFIDPGVVHEINVVRRSNSGHVLEMQFVTEKRGTLTARKDAIRSSLRYVTYHPTTGAMIINSLRSTMVFVQPVTDPKTKALVGFEAWGGGWGHGVGMNQTGAVGMAEKGRTYQEILAHYYRGATLEKRWE